MSVWVSTPAWTDPCCELFSDDVAGTRDQSWERRHLHRLQQGQHHRDDHQEVSGQVGRPAEDWKSAGQVETAGEATGAAAGGPWSLIILYNLRSKSSGHGYTTNTRCSTEYSLLACTYSHPADVNKPFNLIHLLKILSIWRILILLTKTSQLGRTELNFPGSEGGKCSPLAVWNWVGI